MKKALNGFTLIELIVVVSVIAVLAGIITPAVGGLLDDAKDAKMIAECKTLALACLQYEKLNGYLPCAGLGGWANANYAYANTTTQTNQLNTLVSAYVGRRIVNDPWSMPYMYHQYYAYNPPARAVTASYGKDKGNQGEWNGNYWMNRTDIVQNASQGGYYIVFK